MLRLLLKQIAMLIGLSPGFVFAKFDHSAWDRLLNQHIVVQQTGKITQVDYAGMSESREILSGYLREIAAVRKADFDGWSLDDQLAFLINTYNAGTVELVLTAFPGIDSIKDIGSWFRSPWSRPVVSLFGGQVSLDDIEHGMIRGWGIYNEPRIHFAVNCAAIGCPPLRAEAYSGNQLQQQLDANTRLFLADRNRNYVDGNRIYVSKLFDWYAEDFEQGWQGVNSVHEFLATYSASLQLDSAQETALRNRDLRIRHLDYDWGLNRVP